MLFSQELLLTVSSVGASPGRGELAEANGGHCDVLKVPTPLHWRDVFTSPILNQIQIKFPNRHISTKATPQNKSRHEPAKVLKYLLKSQLLQLCLNGLSHEEKKKFKLDEVKQMHSLWHVILVFTLQWLLTLRR